MSKRAEVDQTVENQGEALPIFGDGEVAGLVPLTYEEPEVEEGEEGEGVDVEAGEDEELEYPTSDWRHEAQSEARRILESLNPRFYSERRKAREYTEKEPIDIPADVVVLHFTAENVLKLMRATNKGGVTWNCREEATVLTGTSKSHTNNHDTWMLLGHAAPEGSAKIQVLCLRKEGKNGDSTLEFRVL